ncbi:MAG: hypothetical protein JRI25_11000 [Deltaproteobacteria bacterium]|nr:hypothetical protein [Deltaproteobacteria bacterium]MBW2255112.1 hypothetical protein [Deltaproteobacteria bacterium]
MTIDAYTRFLLTVIAIALAVIAVRGISPQPAWATDRLECRLEGPVEIRSFSDELDVRLRDVAEPIEVKVSHAFAEPGTSTGNPLYVQVVQ